MVSATATDQLIARLGADDWRVRHGALGALLDMGPDAIEPVAAALAHADENVRWGAARILERIGDRRAVPPLVERLEDTNASVRYLAAVALGSIGDDALLPVLRALLVKSESPWLQEGAHHVFRVRLAGDHAAAISPVIVALEGPDRAIAVLPRVDEALKAIEGFA